MAASKFGGRAGKELRQLLAQYLIGAPH